MGGYGRGCDSLTLSLSLPSLTEVGARAQLGKSNIGTQDSEMASEYWVQVLTFASFQSQRSWLFRGTFIFISTSLITMMSQPNYIEVLLL